MANSTTNLDQISVSQAQKEVVVNENFDAGSSSMAFGRRASGCSGLTWAYYGGTIPVSGTPTQVANGTVTLTASTTNRIYRSSSGTVTCTTSTPSGWPGPLAAGAVALYQVVTGPDGATSWTDYRLAQGDVGPQGNSLATVIVETGTSRTLSSGDNASAIHFSNGSDITLNMAGSLGTFQCVVVQEGAGKVVFTANGQTLNVYGGYTKTAGAGAMATIMSRTSGTFFVSGTLA